MKIIDYLSDRAKTDIKKIILPESMDSRVLEAANEVQNAGIADIIIIGDEKEIFSLKPDLNKSITIYNQKSFDKTEEIIEKLYELRKEKGLTFEQAKDFIMNDNMYFACMLVKLGMADGIVSGACHSTSNTLRPALQIIKTKPGTELVSAFFLMEVPDCTYGENGVFIFSDCGLEQNPDAKKLACIAESSAESFKLLTNVNPIVAMLSHSTFGSAKHEDVDKVVEATSILKSKNLPYLVDGELQLDAAIDSDVALIKANGSPVAGKANVLIFPDLDAGNIGYKLVQRLAKANAYGPICQGIAAPVNDLSRGCSVSDIVGAVAITAVQAQKKEQ